MPSGVEHPTAPVPDAEIPQVAFALMPSGVEHIEWGKELKASSLVAFALMPSGVEHFSIVSATLQPGQSRSR